jgi:hypothetical protein
MKLDAAKHNSSMMFLIEAKDTTIQLHSAFLGKLINL